MFLFMRHGRYMFLITKHIRTTRKLLINTAWEITVKCSTMSNTIIVVLRFQCISMMVFPLRQLGPAVCQCDSDNPRPAVSVVPTAEAPASAKASNRWVSSLRLMHSRQPKNCKPRSYVRDLRKLYPFRPIWSKKHQFFCNPFTISCWAAACCFFLAATKVLATSWDFCAWSSNFREESCSLSRWLFRSNLKSSNFGQSWSRFSA